MTFHTKNFLLFLLKLIVLLTFGKIKAVTIHRADTYFFWFFDCIFAQYQSLFLGTAASITSNLQSLWEQPCSYATWPPAYG